MKITCLCLFWSLNDFKHPKSRKKTYISGLKYLIFKLECFFKSKSNFEDVKISFLKCLFVTFCYVLLCEQMSTKAQLAVRAVAARCGRASSGTWRGQQGAERANRRARVGGPLEWRQEQRAGARPRAQDNASAAKLYAASVRAAKRSAPVSTARQPGVHARDDDQTALRRYARAAPDRGQ